MTYSDKLLDPRWQKKRLEVFQRDDFTCKLCGEKTETLHVHHQLYERGYEPWDYPLSILETYCHFCHSIVEYFKKSEPEVLVCKTALIVPHSDGSKSFYLICLHKMNASLFVVKYCSSKDIKMVAFIPEQIIEQVSELIESLKNVF
jgi:hypothetical protein